MNPIQARTEEQLSFAWVRDEARAVRAMDALIDAARETLARTERVLHESMEYRDVEAKREKLADTKREALAAYAPVGDAKEALKSARAEMKRTCRAPLVAHRDAKVALKALTTKRTESRDGLIGRVAK